MLPSRGGEPGEPGGRGRRGGGGGEGAGRGDRDPRPFCRQARVRRGPRRCRARLQRGNRHRPRRGGARRRHRGEVRLLLHVRLPAARRPDDRAGVPGPAGAASGRPTAAACAPALPRAPAPLRGRRGARRRGAPAPRPADERGTLRDRARGDAPAPPLGRTRRPRRARRRGGPPARGRHLRPAGRVQGRAPGSHRGRGAAAPRARPGARRRDPVEALRLARSPVLARPRRLASDADDADRRGRRDGVREGPVRRPRRAGRPIGARPSPGPGRGGGRELRVDRGGARVPAQPRAASRSAPTGASSWRSRPGRERSAAAPCSSRRPARRCATAPLASRAWRRPSRGIARRRRSRPRRCLPKWRPRSSGSTRTSTTRSGPTSRCPPSTGAPRAKRQASPRSVRGSSTC